MPRKLIEVRRLIRNKVRENLHLEYKRSDALHGNNIGLAFAKEVSAFAHSDGGIIIFGVEEEDQLPVKFDDGLTSRECSKGRLEQLLVGNINPRIEGVEIHPIPLTKGRAIYVISVPRSNGTVHQVSDHKYYKRHDTQAMPMEDYEINDVRNRKVLISTLVNLRFVLDDSMVFFELENVGMLPAFDLTFSFPNDLPWPFDKPSPFENGIRYLAPGAKMLFMWGSSPHLFGSGEASLPPFEVNITYRHPQIEQIIEDTFYLDLEAYKDSIEIDSDVSRLQKSIKEMTKELASHLEKLHKVGERISNIARPSGLDLSLATLQNLKHIHDGADSLEKIDTRYCSHQVYCEVLKVNLGLGLRLQRYLSCPADKRPCSLEELEDTTPEIIERLRENFLIDW